MELWLYRVRIWADVCRLDITNSGDLQFLTLSNLPDCTIDALIKLQVVCFNSSLYQNPSKDLNIFRNIKYAKLDCGKMYKKEDLSNLNVIFLTVKLKPAFAYIYFCCHIRFSQMVLSSANRQTFINSVISFLREYEFDGLDIDWEYPANRGGSPQDKQYYSVFLEVCSLCYSFEIIPCPTAHIATAACLEFFRGCDKSLLGG